MQLIAKAEHTGIRLDKFLKEHFPDLSRSLLQKSIEKGAVKVNGKVVPAHYFLRAGDKVEAVVKAPEELQVKANRAVQFDIVYEESDFIIINKPAGLGVHQGEGHKAPDTLVNGLLARYPEIARVGDDLVRPGIVHRLDADVSGVMVVARTPDMFDHLKRQFKLHEVEKEYVAVVEGKVSPPSGVIEFALARKGAKMVARPKGAEGRKAVTEYETIPWKHGNMETWKQSTTLLRIATRTGRTHQIRVHLQAKGWPIVGDPLYGTAGTRLLLHAKKIVFTDLTNGKRKFIIEPPFL